MPDSGALTQAKTNDNRDKSGSPDADDPTDESFLEAVPASASARYDGHLNGISNEEGPAKAGDGDKQIP